MKDGLAVVAILGALLVCAGAPASAQDLGPGVKKIGDGIYVYAPTLAQVTGQADGPDDQWSNVNVIVTDDGVVLIDTGHNLVFSRAAVAAVRKLTRQPVRLIIHTETHGDHTVGDFLFSPPALVIGAAGFGALSKQNAPPAKEPAYRNVVPHVEYQNKMTLNMGGRVIELIQLKNVHSGADTAVWLPRERILFPSAALVARRLSIIRPATVLTDVLAEVKMMRALNPAIVVPAHGEPGTTTLLDETESYYTLLLERVGKLAAEGKTLEQAKAQLRMPEFAHWRAQDRLASNVEAAWRIVKRD